MRGVLKADHSDLRLKIWNGECSCTRLNYFVPYIPILFRSDSYIASYHIISYHIVDRSTISFYIISYHIISFYIISSQNHIDHIKSNLIICLKSEYVKSYYISPYHIISYQVISYHTISYHIIIL